MVGFKLYISVSQDFAVKYWRANGAPADKLLVGFPAFARTYKTASANHGVGAATNGAGSAGLYTREAGTLSYYEVRILQSKPFFKNVKQNPVRQTDKNHKQQG